MRLCTSLPRSLILSSVFLLVGITDKLFSFPLEDHTWILVSGLQIRGSGEAPEFHDLINDLRLHQITPILVESGGNPLAEDRSRFIGHHVNESQKPVVLVSYSRGSLDVLLALLSLTREERSRVQSWFSFQGFFQGSALLDRVGQSAGPFSQGSRQILNWLGIHDEIRAALHTEKLKELWEHRESDIMQILEEVPTVTFAGRLGSQIPWWLKYLHSGMNSEQLLHSDGLLLQEAMQLPKAKQVDCQGISHCRFKLSLQLLIELCSVSSL